MAAHKKFPAAVDLRKADHRLWEELTPAETWELLEKALNCDDYFRIAFRYWLYWLQAVRFRATERVFIQLLRIKALGMCEISAGKLFISRLKYGRKILTPEIIQVLYKLYLLSAAERADLKRKVLANGTTTV